MSFQAEQQQFKCSPFLSFNQAKLSPSIATHQTLF